MVSKENDKLVYNLIFQMKTLGETREVNEILKNPILFFIVGKSNPLDTPWRIVSRAFQNALSRLTQGQEKEERKR